MSDSDNGSSENATENEFARQRGDTVALPAAGRASGDPKKKG